MSNGMKAANAAYLERQRADRLRDVLIEALPWVEALLDDPAYKTGSVARVVRNIRSAIEE